MKPINIDDTIKPFDHLKVLLRQQKTTRQNLAEVSVRAAALTTAEPKLASETVTISGLSGVQKFKVGDYVRCPPNGVVMRAMSFCGQLWLADEMNLPRLEVSGFLPGALALWVAARGDWVGYDAGNGGALTNECYLIESTQACAKDHLEWYVDFFNGTKGHIAIGPAMRWVPILGRAPRQI